MRKEDSGRRFSRELKLPRCSVWRWARKLSRGVGVSRKVSISGRSSFALAGLRRSVVLGVRTVPKRCGCKQMILQCAVGYV
jgi:hypothetical protein